MNGFFNSGTDLLIGVVAFCAEKEELFELGIFSVNACEFPKVFSILII